MTYIIIDPTDMTYDGGYVYKDDAEYMLNYWQSEYDQPAMFMVYIEGVPSRTFEPYFRWMADVKIFKK